MEWPGFLKLVLSYLTSLLITLVTVGALAILGAALHMYTLATNITLPLVMMAGFCVLVVSGVSWIFCFVEEEKLHAVAPFCLSCCAVIPVVVGGCLLGFGIAGTLYFHNLPFKKEVNSPDDIVNEYEPYDVRYVHVKDFTVVPDTVGTYLEVKPGIYRDDPARKYYYYAIPVVAQSWDKRSTVPAVVIGILRNKYEAGTQLTQLVVPDRDDGYFTVSGRGIKNQPLGIKSAVSDLAAKVSVDQGNVFILYSADIPAQAKVKQNALIAGLVITPILIVLHILVMILHFTLACIYDRDDGEAGYAKISLF